MSRGSVKLLLSLSDGPSVCIVVCASVLRHDRVGSLRETGHEAV